MNVLLMPQALEITVFCVIGVIAVAIIILLVKLIATKRVSYALKQCYLTNTEKEYFAALKNIAGDDYIVFPQINLASVIDKQSKGYRTELFRNADFGFFTADLRPVLLIEVNDPSHERPDRIKRDKSVTKICKKAGLPLVVFRTRDGVDEAAMRKALRKYLR